HVNHRTDGNSPTVVAHGYFMLVYGNFDGSSGTHYKLVNGIVDNFFQQYIDAVVVSRTVAQLTDVHPRAQPDVFFPVERSDTIFVICGHFLSYWTKSRNNTENC